MESREVGFGTDFADFADFAGRGKSVWKSVWLIMPTLAGGSQSGFGKSVAKSRYFLQTSPPSRPVHTVNWSNRKWCPFRRDHCPSHNLSSGVRTVRENRHSLAAQNAPSYRGERLYRLNRKLKRRAIPRRLNLAVVLHYAPSMDAEAIHDALEENAVRRVPCVGTIFRDVCCSLKC